MSKKKGSNPIVIAALISGVLACIGAIIVAIIGLIPAILHQSSNPPFQSETITPVVVDEGTTAPQTTLEVINSSSEPICYLYIVPTGGTMAGQGQMDEGRTIPPNKTMNFPLETGMYDLRAENCNKEIIAESFNHHVQGQEPWIVDNVEQTNSETSLEVINHTSKDVCYLYVSPSDNGDNWDDNWLDEAKKIEVNQSLTFPMETGMYNVRAEDCQKQLISEYYDVHFQGPMEWELK